MAAATDEIEPSAKRVKVDTETEPEKPEPEISPETTESAKTEPTATAVEPVAEAVKEDKTESKEEVAKDNVEEKVWS